MLGGDPKDIVRLQEVEDNIYNKNSEDENLRCVKPISAAVLVLSVLVSILLAALLWYDYFWIDFMSTVIFAIEIIIVALCGLERKKWRT